MDNSKRARSEKSRTQPREHAYVKPANLQSALERIRQAACRDKKLRFTSLWHHVYNLHRLREAYFNLKRTAAPGVDGLTWRQYGENLEENLQELSGKLKRGAYRAKPVRRSYIPKADGRQRPLGVTALEDKIVQRSTVEVMNAIYETDFLGFSYGFRPRRSPHNALDALCVGIIRKKVNWLLDADVCGFFDAIDHEWLMKFIKHRIADPRVIRHIKKWLNAGIMEEGKRTEIEAGTPQGGSVSPVLANVYLHYVLDLWANQWRRKHARGDVIIVRFADDFAAGFQYREDAERFLEDLRERFRKFHLELHPDKTRLIEFGRYAAENRKRRGEGKPDSFNFLGLTHTCDRTRNGKFIVLRQTIRTRMQAKLREIKGELRKRLHDPIPAVGQWLRSVVQGHFQYYAVPRNQRKLNAFKYQVYRLWFQALRRRSQRHRITEGRMNRLADRWLPAMRILHPYPEQRLRVTTRGRSPVR
jgi:group II intron reverse transcriptase/maturase